jgi:hypothetical protein
MKETFTFIPIKIQFGFGKHDFMRHKTLCTYVKAVISRSDVVNGAYYIMIILKN